ncbi:uncharacterized protein BDR25DRAFT_99478 [Lindgomyces ingoldianus]|uniref:Uncharacterized protein n=1 Tax=Lindgomyces ingoldianus TaxID=673940 RepID=A0ACB6QCK0_9PLEO|nr:uncharacterized protein BDR25DRAFT_99478 [Lindgomyces ingoldianus]KAF2464097.1 hypothetical protein BDR25DRAFT_99478 [Lindgomyces ingoldianus]
MSKGATVSVLYPKTASSTFDISYYLSTHMPLVADTWTKYGLKSWSVTQLSVDAPYSVHALMEWESQEAFAEALKDEGTAKVMGDVENFSSEKPVLLQGEVIGRG